jgi:hypothetical protein
MQGLEAIFDLTTGHGDLGDRGVRFARGRISGLMGGPGRLAKEALDIKRRKGKTTGELVKSEVPGLSRQVRPRLSPFGREIERPGIISPFGVSQPDRQEAKVAREMSRLGIHVEADSIVTVLKDRGERFKVSKGEDVALRKARGSMVKERLLRLIDSPRYKQANPTQQKKMITKTKADIRRAVRNLAVRRKRQGLTFSEELLRRAR